jgi:hypothetical protein
MFYCNLSRIGPFLKKNLKKFYGFLDKKVRSESRYGTNIPDPDSTWSKVPDSPDPLHCT